MLSADQRQESLNTNVALNSDISCLCEDVLKNLKYISKVIIYKDSSKLVKESIKIFSEVKNSVIWKSYLLTKVKLDKEMDQEDLVFIEENFMPINPFDDAMNCALPNKITGKFIFESYGVAELQSILTNVGKN